MKKAYQTPFKELNELMTGGFRPGTLIVIGGVTCMGKTSFLLNLIGGFKDVKKFIYSLEEKVDHFAASLIANDAQVELSKILNKKMTGEEFQRVICSATHLLCPQINLSKILPGEDEIDTMKGYTEDSLTLICDDRESFWETIEEAISNGCKIIMIDSLQRMATKSDIYQEMSLIVNRLREISIKNDVCVIVTSQVSRKILERQGHRPQMSDLRDSGHIEECADQVIFLHRREYYDPHDRPGQAEIIVAKNRFGKTGVITLSFIEECQKFINLI